MGVLWWAFVGNTNVFTIPRQFILIPTSWIFLSPAFGCHISQVFDQPERGLSMQYLEMSLPGH